MPPREFERFATRAIREGDEDGLTRETAGDVAAPIHLSSTFELDGVPQDTSLMDLDPARGEYLYARLGNPTRHALESKLGKLAGSEYAFTFASGTAAVFTTVMATVRPGDQIVAFDDLYGGTVKMLEEIAAKRLDVEVSFVDARDPDNVAAAMSADTALVLMETPTNPLLHLCDIEAIAGIADDHDVPLAVDNTFASPYFQRPLDLGADISIHSMTKYLNGHSDGLGGAVLTNDLDLAEEFKFHQRIGLGNPLPPFDSYMVLRGMKTLPTRMDRQEQNAMELAQYLDAHDRVRSVRYPGLPSHPQHDLANAQMNGFGGVLSFELDGTEPDARRFLEALESITLGVSLGGVESLIELPAAMTHESIDPAVRRERGISDTLIRLSVGIEAVEDLKADLERGFAAAFADHTAVDSARSTS